MSQPVGFFTKDSKVRPITKPRIRRGSRPAFLHNDRPTDFSLKKDYGRVKWYTFRGRNYLVGSEAGGPNMSSDLVYPRRIADILHTLPEQDTKQISYIVIDPNIPHSGELIRGAIPAKVYDEMGKKEALTFLRNSNSTGDKGRDDYGIAFGWSGWDENKNNLPHVVKHEVGHLGYYNLTQGARDGMVSSYESKAEKFVTLNENDIVGKTPQFKIVERVNRSPSTKKIFGIDGLSNINFNEYLWSTAKIPSIYSMKSPSEYFAELYAHDRLGDV